MFRRFGADEWQARLWAIILGLFLIAIYLIAFVVKNDDRIEIDFVLFTSTVSLIWEIVFVLALGVLCGVLLSQIYRRRGEKGSEPADGVGQLRRRGEAEGQPRG
ncbi:MAG: LapA family protein [Actinomycetota bacterium]|nr:LapA family protein [Actinomycetota bacterium]